MYAFLSMSSLETRQNIGCCIVEADSNEKAIHRCNVLNLIPENCDSIKTFMLDEQEFKAQNMTLDTFYPRNEMKEKGFQSESVQVIL